MIFLLLLVCVIVAYTGRGDLGLLLTAVIVLIWISSNPRLA